MIYQDKKPYQRFFSLLFVAAIASVALTEIACSSNNQLEFGERREQFPTLPEEQGGVINVKDYGAKGDGITDDTKAFQRALTRDDVANKGKIIYVPHGVYLVSDTLEWPQGEHRGHYYKRTTLLGESREKTIIKLQDNTPSFSTGKGKPVIDTKHNKANGFFNRLENLTVDTGYNNQDAIGIKFNSNNSGGIFNVSVISGDNQGSHGIDLTGAELGPLLVKNVAVKGFATGIKVGGGKTNSVHMENINLREQGKLGIEQIMQVLTIRNLKSFNQVPAIYVQGHSATLTLIGADLEGKNSNNLTAIETKYRKDEGGTKGEKKTMNTFLVDVKQEGYQQTAQVYNCDTGELEIIAGNIDEWACGAPVKEFSQQSGILRLPVKETPYLENDLINVAIVKGNSGADIQAAIDKPGVKTVFLPNTSYLVEKPILIRGSVKKIVGMRASFARKSTQPIFRFENGEEPVVSLERLANISIEHNAQRSLVITRTVLDSYQNTAAGTGDVFFEDVVSGLIRIRNQNAWARSLNVEMIPPYAEAKILNDGGLLWVLGLKTEQIGTIIETKNNGSTEVLGGLIYINKSIPDTNPKQAQYINDQSQVSIVTRSYLPSAKGYEVLVREIQDESVKDLTNPNRRGEGRLFPYLGH